MELLPQGIDRRLSNDLNQCPRCFSAFPTGAWSGTDSVSSGGMFDMLQLVGEVGKKRLLRMQERRYLSLRKVSIASLDDKLKLSDTQNAAAAIHFVKLAGETFRIARYQ